MMMPEAALWGWSEAVSVTLTMRVPGVLHGTDHTPT